MLANASAQVMVINRFISFFISSRQIYICNCIYTRHLHPCQRSISKVCRYRSPKRKRRRGQNIPRLCSCWLCLCICLGDRLYLLGAEQVAYGEELVQLSIISFLIGAVGWHLLPVHAVARARPDGQAVRTFLYLVAVGSPSCEGVKCFGRVHGAVKWAHALVYGFEYVELDVWAYLDRQAYKLVAPWVSLLHGFGYDGS